jgi:hypothetical protein
MLLFSLFYIKPRVTFKGGSPPSIPNPSFFLASPNLGDEIPFKGGSLSHPKNLKFLNVKKMFLLIALD